MSCAKSTRSGSAPASAASADTEAGCSVAVDLLQKTSGKADRLTDCMDGSRGIKLHLRGNEYPVRNDAGTGLASAW